MKIETKAWIRIAIYYSIAITLSFLFRLELFDWNSKWTLPFGLTTIIKSLLEASGPFLGALLVLKIAKIKSQITLFGTQVIKSNLMIALPILLFTIFGANNNLNLNRHYYGFIIGLSIALYGVMEEYGWRGFLQNELIKLKPFQKSLIIGVLWYAWHLTFLSKEANVVNELKFLSILIFASWGIGAIAEKTKSIIASACFHILGNIISFSPLISNAIDSQTQYMIFGICLVSWFIMVNTWDKKINFFNKNESSQN